MARLRPEPLPRGFYDRDARDVARDVLGKALVRTTKDGLTAGRIVEAEAYLPETDPASHAYRGRTNRNASMFGPPGCAYVYMIHARFCLNLVTQPEGVASAVLIRAVEPLDGIDLMRRRRGRDDLRKLASGPARLCEALAIDRSLDGYDLTRGRALWLARGGAPRREIKIVADGRIGVASAQHLELRFSIADSPYVSRRPKRIGP